MTIGHGAIDLGSLLIMRRRLLTRVGHLLAKVYLYIGIHTFWYY